MKHVVPTLWEYAWIYYDSSKSMVAAIYSAKHKCIVPIKLIETCSKNWYVTTSTHPHFFSLKCNAYLRSNEI